MTMDRNIDEEKCYLLTYFLHFVVYAKLKKGPKYKFSRGTHSGTSTG
jgi:hypothetical protein